MAGHRELEVVRSREGRVHVQWFHLIALIIRIHGTKYSALLGIKVALH